MNSHILSEDAQVILLLCGQFGKSAIKPLTLKEYNQVVQWLQQYKMRPADLLNPETQPRLKHIGLNEERLIKLLARGGAMSLTLEKWTNQGLWVLTRSDADYPKRLKQRLKELAPPILYGVGDKELLSGGGLAIVGSRNATEPSLAFTRELATQCAKQWIQVVSGGARGVDSVAMETALEMGGVVIGVLANSLARAAVSGKYREFIMQGRLILVSPYGPQAGFNVGNAMGRNKHIYALSNWALVMHTDIESGGTWAGAIENMKHNWVPLYVWQTTTPPIEGNQRLIELAGKPLPDTVFKTEVNLQNWLNNSQHLQYGQSTDETIVVTTDEIDDTASIEQVTKPVSSSSVAPTSASIPITQDLFNLVWPSIEHELQTEKREEELIDIFKVRPAQMRDWLSHAMERGKVEKLARPVRYIAVTSTKTQSSNVTQLSLLSSE